MSPTGENQDRLALYISEGACPTCKARLDGSGFCAMCACWWSVRSCLGEILVHWSVIGPIGADPVSPPPGGGHMNPTGEFPHRSTSKENNR